MTAVNNNKQSLIKVRGLSFAHGDRTIFDNVDMDIPRGKVTAVMGPSGTGKTTLLRLIGAQLYPQKGEIYFDGINVHQLKLGELYQLRKRMGLLFQSGALFNELSVFENVAFPLRAHTQLSENFIRDLVLMKLQAVGLRGARHLSPVELSGGMARRVALARTIALDPQMIMYDEPFTGQDPITVGVILQLIRKLNDTLGLTSIVVTHDVKEVCAISDLIYVISDGKIVDSGPPDAMWQSNSEWVHQFMNGLPDGPVSYHYPAKPYLDDLLDSAA